jgi:hypothetical protein
MAWGVLFSFRVSGHPPIGTVHNWKQRVTIDDHHCCDIGHRTLQAVWAMIDVHEVGQTVVDVHDVVQAGQRVVDGRDVVQMVSDGREAAWMVADGLEGVQMVLDV